MPPLGNYSVCAPWRVPAQAHGELEAGDVIPMKPALPGQDPAFHLQFDEFVAAKSSSALQVLWSGLAENLCGGWELLQEHPSLYPRGLGICGQ